MNAKLAFGLAVAAMTASADVREALQKYVDSGEIAGGISVLQQGDRTETRFIGYADVASKRPLTLDSPYMQCSQTKGFCGVTVAILVEEGRLDLDDPVSRFLPEFSELWIESRSAEGRLLRKAKNVLTVRMCLNHTGGFPFELPNCKAMGGWSRRMPLRSVAATAAALPILFEPGTKEQYSNVGIDIGAAVVEQVTGKRWEDFLRERIFDPLGMTATGFRPTDEQLAAKIEMYEVKAGEKAKWRPDDAWMRRPYGDDRVFPSAGAGLWTTARDQLRFYRMLLNLGRGENGVRILKEETVREILASSTRPKGMTGYSLGLHVAPVKPGAAAWFGHGGAWGTECWMDWRRRELKFWAWQAVGGAGPWDKARTDAEDRFFAHAVEGHETRAYTGRLE